MSTERKRIGLGARIKELDLECMIRDRTVCPDELVEPLSRHHAIAVRIRVDAVTIPGRLAVDGNLEPDRFSIRRNYETQRMGSCRQLDSWRAGSDLKRRR